MPSRDLKLSPRKESSRPKQIKIFEIEDIEKHFSENIESIENSFLIANALIEEGYIEEAKDIWRSQIVFLDSAFDFYMHEITKLGIVSMFNGNWHEKTNKYLNLSISMEYLEEAIKNINDSTLLNNWINDVYAAKTMMSYEAFKDICKLLGINYLTIVDNVFYELDSTEKTKNKMKNFIDGIYRRRNLIAHQSDRRSEDAVRQDIKEDEVKQYIETMKKIVHSISNEIKILNA